MKNTLKKGGTLGLAPVLSELQEAGHQQRPQIFPVLSKSLILLKSLEKQHQRQEAWHVRKVPEMKQTAPHPVTGGRERRRRAQVIRSRASRDQVSLCESQVDSDYSHTQARLMKAGRYDVCGMWSNKYQQQREGMLRGSKRKEVWDKSEKQQQKIPAAVRRRLVSSWPTRTDTNVTGRMRLCPCVWRSLDSTAKLIMCRLTAQIRLKTHVQLCPDYSSSEGTHSSSYWTWKSFCSNTSALIWQNSH